MLHVTIGMIVLNEEEYIERNLRQHYEYADKIIIVEGADRLYPSSRLTPDGLSTDQTATIISDFPDPSHKIEFIRHGWTHPNSAQAKCELRNEYLRRTPAGILLVIDADEFYTHIDLESLLESCQRQSNIYCWTLPFIHFWRTPNQFITGQFYDMIHSRLFRVQPGDTYINNHNHPSRNGRELRTAGSFTLPRTVIQQNGTTNIQRPACFHFGFCKAHANYADKQQYYEKRGERVTRFRTWKSRRAWFKPDDRLGFGLKIHPYTGPLPESFTAAQFTHEQPTEDSLPVPDVLQTS